MVSLQAKILWYFLIQEKYLNWAFPFHTIFRDRKKPASSLQAIGKYLLFYFSYTGVTGQN